MHKIILKSASFVFSIVAVTALVAAPAFAAKPDHSGSKPGGGGSTTTPTLLGNDVSWPQCNQSLPSGQAFAIVGVNDGLANGTNPCLSEQLAWAEQSVGGTGQPTVALYVNTANPGLEGSWWPTSNEYNGQVVTSPYGTCTGANDRACAYMYGYAKASDDATIRGVNNPGSYRWWLDVETINSWQADTVANRADMEGMTAYFKSIGATVGLYSTTYQWGQLIGSVSSSSNLYNLPSWIPGSRNEKAAKTACTSTPLTAGSTISMTQFVSQSLDYDHSCI